MIVVEGNKKDKMKRKNPFSILQQNIFSLFDVCKSFFWKKNHAKTSKN